MESYFKKNHNLLKSIVVGLVISLLLLGFSFGVAPYLSLFKDVGVPDTGLTSVNGNASLGLNDWNFTSPSEFANSYKQNSNDLLFIGIRVSLYEGIVDNSTLFNDVAYFQGAITKLFIFQEFNETFNGQILDFNSSDYYKDTWRLLYAPCCPAPNFNVKSEIYDLDPILDTLRDGLVSDIEEFTEFENISDSLQEESENFENLENVLYWEITHVYRDSSRIIITAYGNDLLVKYDRIVQLIYVDSLIGYFPDITSPLNQAFKTSTTKLFPNYTIAVNSLIEKEIGLLGNE